ncbi:MAG: hypothetical protein ACRDIV_23925, partial [Ktedonobacteraceae bacterium]
RQATMSGLLSGHEVGKPYSDPCGRHVVLLYFSYCVEKSPFLEICSLIKPIGNRVTPYPELLLRHFLFAQTLQNLENVPIRIVF